MDASTIWLGNEGVGCRSTTWDSSCIRALVFKTKKLSAGCMRALHYIPLQYITLNYIAAHCSMTWHHIVWHYIALHMSQIRIIIIVFIILSSYCQIEFADSKSPDRPCRQPNEYPVIEMRARCTVLQVNCTKSKKVLGQQSSCSQAKSKWSVLVN